MAFNFSKSLQIKTVASDNSVDVIQVWGSVETADYAKLKTIFDAASTWTGLKVFGKNERYINENADAINIDPASGKKLVSGQLLIERQDKGYVYIKGKLPNLSDDISLIVNSLITGTKTIGGTGGEIVAVTPRVNVGSTIRK